jgi:hypothetical protein
MLPYKSPHGDRSMKMTPAKGRDKAAALVKQFRKDADYYRSTKYKEAHVRNNFIDPFFESLGWDVHNEKRFAPQNREVNRTLVEVNCFPTIVFSRMAGIELHNHLAPVAGTGRLGCSDAVSFFLVPKNLLEKSCFPDKILFKRKNGNFPNALFKRE